MMQRVRLVAAVGLVSVSPCATAGEDVQASVSCSAGSGEVAITYSAVWRDSCTPNNATVQVVGGRVELHAIAPGGICLTVLTPFTISGSVGGLCDGVRETVVVIESSNGVELQRIPGPTLLVDCAPADFNNDCAVSVQDIFDFLGAYFGGDNRADVNGDGSVSVQDIFDFLAAYFRAG